MRAKAAWLTMRLCRHAPGGGCMQNFRNIMPFRFRAPLFASLAAASALAAMYGLQAPGACAGRQFWAPHAGGCVSSLPAEPVAEAMAAQAQMNARAGRVPDGAFRKAVEGRRALQARKAEVAGASGRWQEYGRGTLITKGAVAALDSAPGPLNGRAYYSGRVDNFAYDPVHMRLFAAVGSGGIWMSEAVNGDVPTSGVRWATSCPRWSMAAWCGPRPATAR